MVSTVGSAWGDFLDLVRSSSSWRVESGGEGVWSIHDGGELVNTVTNTGSSSSVAFSERGKSYGVIFRCVSEDDLLRFLYKRFGNAVRRRLGLTPLLFRVYLNETRAGARRAVRDEDGWYRLQAVDGSLQPQWFSDEVTALSFTYVDGVPVADIHASVLDPEGNPALHGVLDTLR